MSEKTLEITRSCESPIMAGQEVSFFLRPPARKRFASHGSAEKGRATELRPHAHLHLSGPSFEGRVSLPIDHTLEPDEPQYVTLKSSELPPGAYRIVITAYVREAPPTTESAKPAEPPTPAPVDPGLHLVEETLDEIWGETHLTILPKSDVHIVSSDKMLITAGQVFWANLRDCVAKRSYRRYERFISFILCSSKDHDGEPHFSEHDRHDVLSMSGQHRSDRGCWFRHGVRAYEVLKTATEAFLLCHACCQDSIHPEHGSTASDGVELYLAQLAEQLKNQGVMPTHERDFPFCGTGFRERLCLYELIWSYWIESAMLVQTMNAISLRFQNRRVSINGRDPLGSLELHPLRRLNNLLWGYVQSDNDRITVRRRALEYEHEYGLCLIGKAVGDRSPLTGAPSSSSPSIACSTSAPSTIAMTPMSGFDRTPSRCSPPCETYTCCFPREPRINSAICLRPRGWR